MVFLLFVPPWADSRNCSGLSDLRALTVALLGDKSPFEWGVRIVNFELELPHLRKVIWDFA